MRRIAPLILVALCCGYRPLAAKSVKIRGYVTAIKSPTEFEIDDYRITRDSTLVLDFEKAEDPEEKASFRPEEIRVGTEMEIRGEFDEATRELKAKSIKVNLEEHQHVKRTALLEVTPQLKRIGNVWQGEIHVDGQRIVIAEDTLVTIKPNNTQKKASKEAEKAAKKQQKSGKPPEAEADSEEQPGVALERTDQIRGNTFVSYQGTRQKDGSILAKKVEFTENELTKGEARLWKLLTPKVKPPAYTTGRPGELRIQRIQKYKLTPNEDVQKYVQDLGNSLVPRFQREMATGDPQKIPFQFFVVDDKTPNAFSLANGTIVVNTGILMLLENEAQLAAVIGHEIAHSSEEHTLRQLQYHKKALTALRIGAAIGAAYGGRALTDLANLTEAAIRNGYNRSLENQADRVGMEYMMNAGYDPREAPRVWKVMAMKAGDHPTNFFWSTHDNDTTRRSYLMSELKNNYGGVDFETYKRDDPRFAAAVGALKASITKRQKVKVKY
jgi:Peptidase family M48